MSTIEQAREVSKRLHLGASIANDRHIDKDFAILAKAAGNTIDVLIAELAALKAQEPVGHLTLDGDFIQNQRWVMEFGVVPRGKSLYLAAGAQEQRKPLTYDQLSDLTPGTIKCLWSDFVTIARAIEAAHGIKEQP